jgi:hypothetical protein
LLFGNSRGGSWFGLNHALISNLFAWVRSRAGPAQ